MLIFYRGKHREMWQWVAARLAGRTPERADKKNWPGWRKIVPNPQHCFACMATGGNCDLCPVQWESVRGLPVPSCQVHAKDWRDRSLFEFYREELSNIQNLDRVLRRRAHGKELSLIAARIAELPLSPTYQVLWREEKVRIV